MEGTRPGWIMEDYYKVLGLERGATLKEISAAYRAQALIHHPDKRKITTPDEKDDEKFHKIKTAYQSLQDPKIRAELDLQLIGQEERIKRDSQMSAQRKQMRDDLLNREREAALFFSGKKREIPTTTTTEQHKKSPNSIFKDLIKNESATLLLKCKFPQNIDKNLALEMIKTSLNPLNLYENSSTVAVEFGGPQEAYVALSKLPDELIVKAEWFKGYPPDGIKIGLGPKQTKISNNPGKTTQSEEKVKYSKELEESVLEKLKRKKLEKQQQEKQN